MKWFEGCYEDICSIAGGSVDQAKYFLRNTFTRGPRGWPSCFADNPHCLTNSCLIIFLTARIAGMSVPSNHELSSKIPSSIIKFRFNKQQQGVTNLVLFFYY